MKKERFAVYNNKVYSADYIKGKGIVLRSEDEKDIYSNGFQKYEGYNKKIVAIKFVDKSDISEFYQLNKIAVYLGYKFEIVEERAEKISIVAMTGDYRDWINLGMECIDKGVYQKWVDRNEVEIEVVKEQLSY